MKRYIMVVPYVDGVASSNYEATAADIAEAHPKCGTCRFYGRNSSLRVKPCNACMNPRSPYFVVADDIINPALDYCRHHSELNKETP